MARKVLDDALAFTEGHVCRLHEDSGSNRSGPFAVRLGILHPDHDRVSYFPRAWRYAISPDVGDYDCTIAELKLRSMVVTDPDAARRTRTCPSAKPLLLEHLDRSEPGSRLGLGTERFFFKCRPRFSFMPFRKLLFKLRGSARWYPVRQRYQGQGLPLDLWSNVAGCLTGRTLCPLRTIPPSVVAAGVHTPPWPPTLLGRPRPPATVDRIAGAEDCSSPNDEGSIWNSQCHQRYADTNHNEERDNKAYPNSASGYGEPLQSIPFSAPTD